MLWSDNFEKALEWIFKLAVAGAIFLAILMGSVTATLVYLLVHWLLK